MAVSVPELPSDLSAIPDARLSEVIEALDSTLKKLKDEKARRDGASKAVDDIDPTDPVALKKFLVNLREEVSSIKSSASKPAQPANVEYVAYVASKEKIEEEKKKEWSSHPDRPSWTYPQPNPKDPWLYYI